MKVFFDTNVYVAEALLGDAAARMARGNLSGLLAHLHQPHVLEEIERVMVERLGFSRRFALLTRRRARRRATLVMSPRAPVTGCRTIPMTVPFFKRLWRQVRITSSPTTPISCRSLPKRDCGFSL